MKLAAHLETMMPRWYRHQGRAEERLGVQIRLPVSAHIAAHAHERTIDKDPKVALAHRRYVVWSRMSNPGAFLED